jgi:hypothetical protein
MNKPLLELFELGGKNNFEFRYKNTETLENVATLDTDNRIITVSIGDPTDEVLDVILNDLKRDLQKFLDQVTTK